MANLPAPQPHVLGETVGSPRASQAEALPVTKKLQKTDVTMSEVLRPTPESGDDGDDGNEDSSESGLDEETRGGAEQLVDQIMRGLVASLDTKLSLLPKKPPLSKQFRNLEESWRLLSVMKGNNPRKKLRTQKTSMLAASGSSSSQPPPPPAPLGPTRTIGMLQRSRSRTRTTSQRQNLRAEVDAHSHEKEDEGIAEFADMEMGFYSGPPASPFLPLDETQYTSQGSPWGLDIQMAPPAATQEGEEGPNFRSIEIEGDRGYESLSVSPSLSRVELSSPGLPVPLGPAADMRDQVSTTSRRNRDRVIIRSENPPEARQSYTASSAIGTRARRSGRRSYPQPQPASLSAPVSALPAAPAYPLMNIDMVEPPVHSIDHSISPLPHTLNQEIQQFLIPSPEYPMPFLPVPESSLMESSLPDSLPAFDIQDSNVRPPISTNSSLTEQPPLVSQGDRDGRRKRQKPAGHDKQDLASGRKFACPYYQRNPRKYSKWTSCPGPGWDEVHRVKSHLYRRHTLAPHCPRCWKPFKTDAAMRAHLQADPPCLIGQATPVLEGFTKDQEKKLRSRKKTQADMTDDDKWREIYQILFPDDDPSSIPSAYYDTRNDDEVPALNEMEDYARFVRREMPTLVRRELETLFRDEFQDVEERLRPRVANIVLRMQPRLLQLYRQSSTDPQESDSSTSQKTPETTSSATPPTPFVPVTNAVAVPPTVDWQPPPFTWNDFARLPNSTEPLSSAGGINWVSEFDSIIDPTWFMPSQLLAAPNSFGPA